MVAVGVSTQTAPANRSASAPSTPSCSEPAIGWPPTKRGSADGGDDRGLHAADVGDEPRVAGQGGPGGRRRRARTGVATNVISASGSAADRVEGAELERPRGRRGVVVVAGDVPAPRAAGRSPIEPPMRPVPTTRGAASAATDQSGRSSRRPDGALEVHVAQLARGSARW